MGSIINSINRYGASLAILIPLVAGTIIGIAGFLIKIVMSNISLSATFILDLLLTPLTYLAGALSIAGFLLLQKALYKGKVSVVTPIIAGLGILVPVLLATAFLGEVLSTAKIAGIVLILIGVFGLRD